MKDFLYKIWSSFLTWFGKIKIMTFGWLPVLAQDVEPYYIDGYDIFDILKILEPGDVLIRGYDDYLDGKFIPDENGYSHAGMFIGNEEVIHAVSPTVDKIHIVDFCLSDRIMVLRPIEGQIQAIISAYEKIGQPYDFNYKTDDNRIYCFELIDRCYPQAKMKTHVVKKFWGIVKRKCFLAKSIYQNPFFKKVYEKNRKTKED